MVGLMSKEFYHFYTGPYGQALNQEHKGIMPLNVFQDQGNEPLTNILNPKSHSSGLNFKLTDLCECSIYDTTNAIPKVKRVEVLSSIHIAQKPGKKHGTSDNPDRRELLGDELDREFHDWTENEVPL